MNKSRKSTLISIALLFFISAFIMLRQLISSDYFSCHIEDTFAYVSWAGQFVEALKEGILYPRWNPLKFWGYGSPYILYSPLAFYLVAFFNVFTGSVIMAMNLTKFTALFCSGIGLYFLVKQFYSEKVALLTASFYLVFPYNIFQFYYIGTFASSVSLMWFSPIVLFTYRYIEQGQNRNILYAGVCYGGLILTHLINAYMFTFVLVTFIVYMSIVKKRPGNLMLIPLITTVGFLISAAYVLPLLHEKQFVNTKAFIGERGGICFDFRNFFIIPNMIRKFSPGHLWPAYYTTFVFFIFFFCILIVLFLLQRKKLYQKDVLNPVHKVNAYFLGLTIATIFFLFGISTFVWDNFPYFKYIQFPHRWLNVTAFSVVFLSASLFYTMGISSKIKRGHNLFIVLLFLSCFLYDYKYIYSAHFITKKQVIPVMAENLYVVNIPAWVDINQIDKDTNYRERIIIKRGQGKAEIRKWESAYRVIVITAEESITVRVRTFNFPGWKAYVDQHRTDIKTEKGTGAMLIDIPKGQHSVILKFGDTPVRSYSKVISVVSFLMVVLGVIFLKKDIRKSALR